MTCLVSHSFRTFEDTLMEEKRALDRHNEKPPPKSCSVCFCYIAQCVGGFALVTVYTRDLMICLTSIVMSHIFNHERVLFAWLFVWPVYLSACLSDVCLFVFLVLFCPLFCSLLCSLFCLCVLPVCAFSTLCVGVWMDGRAWILL